MGRLRIAGVATVLMLVGFAIALKFPASSTQAQGAAGATYYAKTDYVETANARPGYAAPLVRALGSAVQESAAARSTEASVAQSHSRSSNAAITIATNISARSLAVEPQLQSSSGAGAAENSGAPESARIYLTNKDQGNRIFALAATLNSSASANAFSAGRLAFFAGQALPGSLGDGGAAAGAEFDLKLDSLAMRSGVAVAPDGTVFVADTLNSTIRSIAGAASSEPGIVRSVAGRFGPRQNFELNEPLGLALDRAGNLYIADRAANAVLMLHAAASDSPGALEILGHVVSPASVAVTLDGSKVFAASADTGAIVAIDTRTHAIASAGISARNISVAAQTRASGVTIVPAGLAVDGAGNLFVSFSGSGAGLDQILRLDAASAKVKSIARGLSSPGEIAFDSNGNLFVADQGTRRLLAFRSEGVPATGVTLTPPADQVPYGPQPVAGTSPTQAFTLANNTSATISQITSGFQGANAGDFTVLNTSCTGTLLADTSCTLNVAFVPQATGARSASLAVTYTSAGVQSTLTAAVTGTGDDYEITLASGAVFEVTIAQGFAATFQMQVVPDDTFSGPVKLLCPTGSKLPAATTCGISMGTTVTTPLVPSLTVDVTAGTAVPFNVTFQTTSTASATSTTTTTSIGPGAGIFAGDAQSNWPSGGEGPAAQNPAFEFSSLRVVAPIAGALGVLAVALIFIPASFRKRIVAGLALAAIFAVALSGCHHSTTTGIVVTPKGTYNFTVQGTAQNATRGFTVTVIVD